MQYPCDEKPSSDSFGLSDKTDVATSAQSPDDKTQAVEEDMSFTATAV